MITLTKFINNRREKFSISSKYSIWCYLIIEDFYFENKQVCLLLSNNESIFNTDINLELYTNKESLNFFLNYIKGKKLIDLLRLGFECVTDEFKNFIYNKEFWQTKLEDLKFLYNDNIFENTYIIYSFIHNYSNLGPSFISYGLKSGKIIYYKNKKHENVSYDEWLKIPEVIKNQRINKLKKLNDNSK